MKAELRAQRPPPPRVCLRGGGGRSRCLRRPDPFLSTTGPESGHSPICRLEVGSVAECCFPCKRSVFTGELQTLAVDELRAPRLRFGTRSLTPRKAVVIRLPAAAPPCRPWRAFSSLTNTTRSLHAKARARRGHDSTAAAHLPAPCDTHGGYAGKAENRSMRTRRRIITGAGAATCVAALASVEVTGGASAGPSSGLSGHVLYGPTCPVQRIGQRCERPYRAPFAYCASPRARWPR
jgi:hypothetical protein